MLVLLASLADAAPPAFCADPPPEIPVRQGPFAPDPRATRVALDAAAEASWTSLCGCLPERVSHWPRQVRFSLLIAPEDGRGTVSAALPFPLDKHDEALVACLGTPTFTFPAYAYKSDMIVDGEAAPARFAMSWLMLLTLDE
ncbi:MAG: hypothetical protein EP330_08005 [Deltaproteobacteria bacterium]|nr:MAG: hypothetical protein EP330_08005 [Deltaproteobacteria bacterium]